MNQKATIVIADRSAHIRNLLKRELLSCGYRVRVARDCTDLLRWLAHPSRPDLLVIDPDLPTPSSADLFAALDNRPMEIAVIVHGFAGELAQTVAGMAGTVFLEKNADSIDSLKEMVSTILAKRNGSRIQSDIYKRF